MGTETTPDCLTPAHTDHPFKTRRPDLKLTEFSGEVDGLDTFWDNFQVLGAYLAPTSTYTSAALLQRLVARVPAY